MDLLPWLQSLGNDAHDFPEVFPVDAADVERGVELASRITAFAKYWLDVAPPVAPAVAHPVAPAVASPRPPAVESGIASPAVGTTPVSTVVKRRAAARRRQADSRARKRLRVDIPDRVPEERGSGATAANGMPRGSKRHWNTKLQGVLQNARDNVIPGALANYVQTLDSGMQTAVRGGMRVSEDRVGMGIVSSLRAAFASLASSRCKQDRDIQLAGAAMAFGEGASETVQEVARVLGIKVGVVTTGQLGHRNLQAGIGLGLAARRRSGLLKGLVTEVKKKAKDALNAEVLQKVRDFWLSPGITRVSTCKRDVIRIPREDGTVERASMQWLEMTQLEVFRRFKKKEPDAKIGLRTFEQKKPKQVRRLTRRDTISCCCRYHEDFRLALTAYNRAHEVLHSKCECEDMTCCPLLGGQRAVLSNRKPTVAFPDKVCGRCEVGSSTSTFVASLLCPKPTGADGEPAEFHAMPCLDGSCEACGGLRNLKLCEAEIGKAGQLVEWSTYESAVVGTDDDGKNKHRIQFVQKKTPVGELVSKLQGCMLGHVPGGSKKCLCAGKFVLKDAKGDWAVKELAGVSGQTCPFLKPYPYHCFMAQYTMNMFNKCKENLPLGHCLLLFDFSENHALNIPRAIQSLHWIVKQASLLCCVLWRHAVKEVDGVESTEENPIIVKDYLYFMGDDMPHSHRAIQHMRKLIVKEYFQKRGIPLPKFVHEWADGSAAQNKCGTAFADVVESGRPMEWERGLGIPCQRNFFETSHARGEQDAMGVAVKHEASLAVMATTDKWYGKILNARDLYEFCLERLRFAKDQGSNRRSAFGKRFFFLVEDGDVDESGQGFKTVDGTLALHSVRAGVGLMVGLKRDRPCYCDYCYAQCEQPQPDSEGCHNKGHVDEWVPFTMVAEAVGEERRTRMRAAEHAHDVAQVEVSRGSIFARSSGGDENHQYYLVKALGGVHQVLDADGIKDDYYTPGVGVSAGAGVHATPGEFVVEGRFLEWRDESTCTEYFVDNSRKCLTYSHHIVCVEVAMRKRKVGGRDYLMVPEAEHHRILAALVQRYL